MESDVSFLETSLELFQQKYAPDLGAEQYVHHCGLDQNGKPMSGALLWARAEAQRIRNARLTGSPNILDVENRLVRKLHQRIRDYVSWHNGDELCRNGLSLLECGPGTVRAFQSKTLPLVTNLQGQKSRCILVDRSNEFLLRIAALPLASALRIEFIRDDVFSGHRYFAEDEAALIVMFGKTFGNLAAPVSDKPPVEAVVRTLQKIANSARQGWLAISVGSDLRGERAQAYYQAHPEFQLNIFYRMRAELLPDGNFFPENFEYKADIRGDHEFMQVVHTAVVRKDMCFRIDNKEITLRKHDRLHLKNSFCFSAPFFQKCARLAGTEPIDLLSDETGSDIHVLRKVS